MNLSPKELQIAKDLVQDLKIKSHRQRDQGYIKEYLVTLEASAVVEKLIAISEGKKTCGLGIVVLDYRRNEIPNYKDCPNGYVGLCIMKGAQGVDGSKYYTVSREDIGIDVVEIKQKGYGT